MLFVFQVLQRYVCKEQYVDLNQNSPPRTPEPKHREQSSERNFFHTFFNSVNSELENYFVNELLLELDTKTLNSIRLRFEHCGGNVTVHEVNSIFFSIWLMNFLSVH